MIVTLTLLPPFPLDGCSASCVRRLANTLNDIPLRGTPRKNWNVIASPRSPIPPLSRHGTFAMGGVGGDLGKLHLATWPGLRARQVGNRQFCILYSKLTAGCSVSHHCTSCFYMLICVMVHFTAGCISASCVFGDLILFWRCYSCCEEGRVEYSDCSSFLSYP